LPGMYERLAADLSRMETDLSIDARAKLFRGQSSCREVCCIHLCLEARSTKARLLGERDYRTLLLHIFRIVWNPGVPPSFRLVVNVLQLPS
jgi:hypothetical protein